MQRLSYVLLALTLGFSQNQGLAQDAFYSIAGDVSAPQSHRYPKGQLVRLRDLLDDAGYNDAAGVARILRGTPLRTVMTDSVTPEMTSRGSLLLPGDVVVFRSFDGYCPGKQNALAMFESGPIMLQIPGGGYPASLLFELNQIPPEGSISVTRTRGGSADQVNLSHHEFIQHGDVINLGGITQTAGLRTSQGYTTIPDLAESQPDGVPMLNNVQELQPAIEITAEEEDASPTSAFPAPPVDAESETLTAVPKLSPSLADTGQMLLQTDNTMITDTTVDGDPFQTAALEKLSAISDFAPPAASPVDSVTGETSNSAWDVLFVAGLAMATGLIVFGWLKTKQEQAAIHEFVDSLHSTRLTGEQTGSSASVPVPAQTAPDHDEQTNLQAVEASTATENFTVSVVSGDCPILSAGLEEIETVGGQTFDAAADAILRETAYADDVTKSYREGTIDAGVLEIQTSEWFEGTWLHEGTNEHSARNVTEEEDAGSAQRATEVGAVTAANTASPDSETFRDLEELLHNRMPVDIRQADLPLHIALFGNAAGPRRLRIDAAHTQVAASHILTSARQKRKPMPTTVAASGPEIDVTGSPSADTAASNADYERFDRALDLLEGQSDS